MGNASLSRTVFSVQSLVLLDYSVKTFRSSLDENVVVQGEVWGDVRVLGKGVGVLGGELGKVLFDEQVVFA